MDWFAPNKEGRTLRRRPDNTHSNKGTPHSDKGTLICTGEGLQVGSNNKHHGKKELKIRENSKPEKDEEMKEGRRIGTGSPG